MLLYVKKYPEKFSSLETLLNSTYIETSSESDENLLEPWIQWVSVYTCLDFLGHGVFRLGDIITCKNSQIFEQIEAADFKVGLVGGMNADNRLADPSYFIPDPWTATFPDKSFWSNILNTILRQAVNDNSKQRLTIKSMMLLIVVLVRFAKIKHYFQYIRFYIMSWKKIWYRALFLDLLLFDVHWSLYRSKRANFSFLFLNGGAHLQHHYFLNSELLNDISHPKNPSWYCDSDNDPILDMLDLYNSLVGEILERSDLHPLIVTGLSQEKSNMPFFYYRLKDHSDFLKMCGIEFDKVEPRMSRDFLVTFSSEQNAETAQLTLSSIMVGPQDVPLFGEIDKRENSLHVTLTYHAEIVRGTKVVIGERCEDLLPLVSFVALKNGIHQSKGWAFFPGKFPVLLPPNGSHVLNIGGVIKKYFGLEKTS